MQDQSKIKSHTFWDKNEHKRIGLLALPMVLSNITTPLLGMVDIAVIGHMGEVGFIAGAAIGAMIVTQLYWICGFIRMSVTGLSAQTKGNESVNDAAKCLYQSLLVSLVLGIAFVVLQGWVLSLGLFFADAAPNVTTSIVDYFNVRIWGAPAALANLAVIGWLIGQQRVKAVLILQVAGNILNVILDFLFVYGFELGVPGVAAASVIAEYSLCVGGLYVALSRVSTIKVKSSWFVLSALRAMLVLNSNMLVRNLALQLCLAFITFQGARLGELVVATNALLMQFFVLAALGLDGVAYAVEALIGESKGAGSHQQLVQRTWQGMFWSSVVASLYCVVYILFDNHIIALLTDIPLIHETASQYLIFIWLLPIVGQWCFLFDGVFVGLTRAKAMRNSMLASCLLVFFPVWWLLSENGNQALWSAFLFFLLARGILLGGYFIFLQKKRTLVE